jgi:hypothetical protein
MHPVIYHAERIGNAFRGEVLDGETFDTLIRTSKTYPNEVAAKQAAKRLWAERQVRLARATGLIGEVA